LVHLRGLLGRGVRPGGLHGELRHNPPDIEVLGSGCCHRAPWPCSWRSIRPVGRGSLPVDRLRCQINRFRRTCCGFPSPRAAAEPLRQRRRLGHDRAHARDGAPQFRGMLRQRRPRGISLHLFQLNFPGKRGRPPSWQQRQRACENVTTRYAGAKGASASNAADKTHILDEIGDRHDDVDASIQVLLDSGMSTYCLREAAARGVDVRGAADLRWSHCALGLLVWVESSFAVYGFSPAPGLVVFAFLLVFTGLFIKSEKDRKAFVGTAIAKSCVSISFLVAAIGLCRGKKVLRSDYRLVLLETVFRTLLVVAGRGRAVSVLCVGPWVVQVLGPGCRCCCRRLRRRAVEEAGRASTSNRVEQQKPKVDSNPHVDAP